MSTPDLNTARYLHIAIPYAPDLDEYHLITFSDGVMDELECEEEFLIPNFDSENLLMNFTIDLQSGTVENWQREEFIRIWGKIRDEGTYTLLDKDQTPIIQITGYVPNRLLPPFEEGYGDYLELAIHPDGPSTTGHPLPTSPSSLSKVTRPSPSVPINIARQPSPSPLSTAIILPLMKNNGSLDSSQPTWRI